MKLFRKALATIVAALVAVSAFAQTYPINNPTYIPTAILSAQAFTSAGTATFNNNGNGTILIRVAGTNSALTATVQITESRATSPTWTSVPVQTVGGPRISTISANGLYRLNVSGASQVRFNLTALTGTNVIVSMAATPGPEFVAMLPATRQTYTATSGTITPAASATDLMILNGSATKTIRVTRVSCIGTAASAATTAMVLAKRSAANSGGTTITNPTLTPHDSASVAATGTVLAYSANPTVGTLVGNVRSGFLITAVTSAATSVLPLTYTFGSAPGEQELVLRGVAEGLSINGSGLSFPTSTSLRCDMTWTED